MVQKIKGEYLIVIKSLTKHNWESPPCRSLSVYQAKYFASKLPFWGLFLITLNYFTYDILYFDYKPILAFYHFECILLHCYKGQRWNSYLICDSDKNQAIASHHPVVHWVVTKSRGKWLQLLMVKKEASKAEKDDQNS